MPTTYQYLSTGQILRTTDDGIESRFRPSDDNNLWLEIRDDVLSGAIVIAPVDPPPAPTFAEREHEEALAALSLTNPDVYQILQGGQT